MKIIALCILLLTVVGVHAELIQFSGNYSVQFDSGFPNYQGIPSLSGSYQFQLDLEEIPSSGSFELAGLSLDQFSVSPDTIGSTSFTESDMQMSMFGNFGDWSYFRIKPLSGTLETTDYLSLTFERYNGYDPATSTHTNAFDWINLNVLSEAGYFQGDHEDTDNHGAVFDGTITTQAVPEPNSVALLIIGGVGVFYTRRRKQSKMIRTSHLSRHGTTHNFHT